MYDDYEDSKRGGGVIWLVIGLVVLLLAAVVVIGGALMLQRNRSQGGPPGLVVPTSPLQPRATDEIVVVTLPPNDPRMTMVATSTPVATLTPLATTVRSTHTPVPPPIAGNIDAVSFSNPPLIDGNLTEWGSAPVVESRFQVHSFANWDGTADINAAWQLGWDASNLYVAVRVTDDTHVQIQSGNQIFRGDSVDLQIDTNRNGDYGNGLNTDDFQFIISPGNFNTLPPSAFRFTATSTGQSIDYTGHQVQLAAQKSTDGYILEVAIPWSDIRVTPAQGLVIGLALNVNDNDTPGTAIQEVMNSHVATRRFADPTSWGTMTLR